ncbi:MAG: hypothetical protein ACFB6R_15115 [Alphaproteobacteria bacterium]
MAGLLSGLAACLRLPAPLADRREAELRATASTLAAPPEHGTGEPGVRLGRIPLIGFDFLRLSDPSAYGAYRFEAGEVTLAARVSRVQDDIERAVARLERAGLQAEAIAEADRARLAILATALGSGQRLETGAEIRRRAWHNRAALADAVEAGLAWEAAFQAAADRAVTLEPLGDSPGRLSDGLARYAQALGRLRTAYQALDEAFEALPRSGPAIP